MKILIVEDTEDARLLLADQLQVHGYDVESAVNGVEALEKARKSRPDLIVSDILMPEMDGFELCRQIKRDSILKKLPFVFYTATYTGASDERFALSLGASRFVVKPEDPTRFMSIIEEVISDHESGDLSVPEKPLVSDDILEHMHIKALTEKLDKKILELEKQKEHLQLITDSMPVLISDIGPDYHFHYVNRTYEKWYNIPRPTMLGKHIKDIIGVKTFEQFQPFMQKALNGETVSFKTKISNHGKPKQYVQVQYIPHDYGKDDETGFFELVYDITESKQVENELRQHREHLEELVSKRTAQLNASNKELEAFCYTVSHDLRAPLRVVRGFCKTLQEDYNDALNSPGQSHLAKIQENVIHMQKLIDDLLSLSRITCKDLTYDEVDLSMIANDLIQILHHNYSGYQKECHIREGIKVKGDASLLRVVLQNLLDNAWKFTSHNESAKIEFGSFEQDNVNVYFISDNGAGFDMKQSGRLFDAFQRLHKKEDYPGTGIGLASVKRIIQRHNGEIWATGEPGKGATFYFTIGCTGQQ